MSKQQLPNKIININSADKDFHQKPDENDIANLHLQLRFYSET